MMQIKEKVIIDGLQMVIRQILFQKEPLYTEMTDTIINSARKAHKSSIKSVNAKIKRVQRQIQQIKDDTTSSLLVSILFGKNYSEDAPDKQ